MKRTLRMLSFILTFSLILTTVQVPSFAGELMEGTSVNYVSESFDASGNSVDASNNDSPVITLSTEIDNYDDTLSKENGNSEEDNLYEDAGKTKDISSNDKTEDVTTNDKSVSENEGNKDNPEKEPETEKPSDVEVVPPVTDENPETPTTQDTSGNDVNTDVSDNDVSSGDVSENDPEEELPDVGGVTYRYTVSTPIFSVNDTAVKRGQRITLSTSTLGAQIYYTTNGTKPSSTNGTLYEDAIIVPSSMKPLQTITIRAIAIRQGFNNSTIAKATYTILDESAEWGDIVEADRESYEDADAVPKSLWVTGIPSSKEYTGTAVTLTDLRVYFHKTLLKKNTDYSLKYSSNTNVGTATVTITGKGNYSGIITKTFKITPLSIGNEGVNSSNLSAPHITLAYTGSKQKGTTTVSFKLGSSWVNLKKDTDFTYSYSPSYNYKSVGEHVVSIVGKGNYTGTATFTETICSDKKIISKMSFSKIKNMSAGSSACEPDVKIKDGNYRLVKDTDYTLEYKNNTTPGTATVTVTGMGDYAGVKVLTFKITAINISEVTVSGIANKNYTGLPVTQQNADQSETSSGYVLTYKSQTLVENEDYKVSYSSNINAGKKATIIFTGINRFSGSVKKYYTIKQQSIKADNVVIANSEVKYTKGGAVPEISVSVNEKILKEGTDYTISLLNNKSINDGSKASTIPTVTVTGKGNYKGTVSRTFTIVGGNLESAVMTATDVVYSETAGLNKPTIALYDNGNKLVAGTDYDKNAISYVYEREVTVSHMDSDGNVTEEIKDEGATVDEENDIIPVGTEIRVTVYGKKNYKNSEQSTVFRVVQASLASAKVKIKTQYFMGEPVELSKDDISVTINKIPLSKSDYEIVSYSNNVSKGTAYVILQGNGNYGGTKKCSFTISSKSLQYQVKYDNNDTFMNGRDMGFESLATETMKDSSLSPGGKLSANTYKRTGYSFTGWNTEPDGTGDNYKNKEKFNLKLSEESVVTYGDAVTLYAQWKPVTYKISYVFGYSIKYSFEVTEYTIEDTVVFEEPVIECYYFKGWFRDSKYKYLREGINPGTSGDLKIYGKVVPYKYTIKLSANGGNGKMTSIKDCEYGTCYYLPEATFTRTNYTFKGWNTAADGSGKSYKDGAKVSKLCKTDGGSVTLYAQWEAYTEQYIWDYLMDAIGNEYGVAGLIGNLFAESGLKSNNLQNSYNTKLGMDDETYTKAVDDGTYSKEQFINDKGGYGLAQWTSSGRKAGLYDYAKSLGKSIADLGVQLGYLMKELTTSYRGVLNTLKNATSVKEASDIVLTGFERPADQSDAAKNRRAGYGETFYEKYSGSGSGNSDTGYTKVKTTAVLNVRTGPGTNNGIAMTLPKDSVCTIVEVKAGQGSVKGWGKLKDGSGWISLDWTTEVK